MIKKLYLFLFINLNLLSAFSQPVLSVLPYENAGPMNSDEGEVIEDFFIAELCKSQWFILREDRAGRYIQNEIALIEKNLSDILVPKYSSPDADYISQLLISKERDTYSVYATLWSAEYGIVLFSLKSEFASLSKVVISDLAEEFSYKLAEICSPLASKSTDSLLEIENYIQAESLIHARLLDEGESKELLEDYEILKEFQIDQLIRKIKESLRNGETEQSILLINEYSLLCPKDPIIDEYLLQVRVNIENEFADTSLSLFESALHFYKDENLGEGDKNKNRLAIEFPLSESAENLPHLSYSSYILQSDLFLNQSKYLLKEIKIEDNLIEKKRLIQQSENAAISSLYHDPEQMNGMRELAELKVVDKRVKERELEDYLEGGMFSRIYHPSPLIIAFGIGLSRFYEPNASTQLNDNIQYGIEGSLVRSASIRDAWAISISPGLQYVDGRGDGEGGISSWKKRTRSLNLLCDTSIEYSLSEIRFGLGPHVRLGINYDEITWNESIEKKSINGLSGLGLYSHFTKYFREEFGIDLVGRFYVLNQFTLTYDLQSEIMLRMILDI